MKKLGIICARGGSKGVPGKNIRVLGDKPLIAWAIQSALQSNLLDRVIVSTESEQIAEISRQYGAEIPFMRPAELASDTASHWDVWRHAVNTLKAQGDEIDILVDMHPTCPLRSVEDINACILRLLEDPTADLVTTVTASDHNPYFNMTSMATDGAIKLMIQPEKKITRRQDAPVAYNLTTGVYAMRRDYLFSATSLFAGRVIGVVTPHERSIDIDTEFDFIFAQALIQKMGIGS